MGKMRVHEFAKNHNMASKQVIEIMKTLDIPVKNHMTTITEEQAQRLEKMLKRKRQKC